jgi:threonyl-tRNA synthetase
VAARLRSEGIRVDVADSADQLGKRIRAAKLDKIPYVLVVGDTDVAASTLGVNPRGGDVERDVPLDEFVRRISAEIADQLAAV